MAEELSVSVEATDDGAIWLSYRAKDRTTMLKFDSVAAERVGEELIAYADVVRRRRPGIPPRRGPVR